MTMTPSMDRKLTSSWTIATETMHLELNVNKPKEMVIDFRRKKVASSQVTINGVEVERVERYKYLPLRTMS